MKCVFKNFRTIDWCELLNVSEKKLRHTLYVDLFSKSKDIKKEIRRLVKVAKFFPACDFCDGRPYDGTSKVGYDGKGMIEAGIQTDRPLPYKKYASPKQKLNQ